MRKKQSEWLTAREVAEALNLDVQTVRLKARNGLFPGAFKLPQGRGWMFRRRDITRMVSRQRRAARR